MSCLPDDENTLKLSMKKKCVVKIAKLALLDGVSRRERGRKKAKVKSTDVDEGLLGGDNQIFHEHEAEVEDTEASCSGNPFWWM